MSCKASGIVVDESRHLFNRYQIRRYPFVCRGSGTWWGSLMYGNSVPRWNRTVFCDNYLKHCTLRAMSTSLSLIFVYLFRTVFYLAKPPRMMTQPSSFSSGFEILSLWIMFSTGVTSPRQSAGPTHLPSEDTLSSAVRADSYHQFVTGMVGVWGEFVAKDVAAVVNPGKIFLTVLVWTFFFLIDKKSVNRIGFRQNQPVQFNTPDIMR